MMLNSFMNMKRPGQGYPDEEGIDMGQYGDMPSMLDAGQQQPGRPGARQMFLGGIKNGQPGGNRLLQGLSGFSGSGGFMGGLGNVAKFLI